MGYSEVGHLNMGAGRIVYQELTRITKAIQDGDFFDNKAFLEAVENCKKNAHDKNCREGKINVELFCEVDRPSGRFTKNIRRVLFKWEINI
jgi:hypothetical protein